MSFKYDLVEALLFKGFLEAPLTLGRLTVRLKSLNHLELGWVKRHAYGASTPSEVYRWHLTYATFMLGHVNVLPSVYQDPTALYLWWGQFPSPYLHRLYHHALCLNLAAACSHRHIEAYSYGPYSLRYRAAYKNMSLNSPQITGVPGTEFRGLNYMQVFWSYLCDAEEQRLEKADHWDRAYLVVAPHAPKAYKQRSSKVQEVDRKRQQYRHALFTGTPLALEDREDPIIMAESPQELLEQMEQAMRGEKDHHDRVVEAYVHRRQQEQKAFLAEAAAKAQQSASWRESEDLTGMVPLSPQELKARREAAFKTAQAMGYREGRDD